MTGLGRFLVVLGVVLAAAGLLLTRYPKLPGASWLGRLPGDTYIDWPHVKVYIPFTTCLLVSVVLTLILLVFRR